MSIKSEPVLQNEADTRTLPEGKEDTKRLLNPKKDDILSALDKGSPSATGGDEHSNESQDADAVPYLENASTGPTVPKKTDPGTSPDNDDDDDDDGEEEEGDDDVDVDDDDDFPRFEDATPRGRIVSSVAGQKPKPRPK